MTQKEAKDFKSRQIFLMEVSKAANAKVVIHPPREVSFEDCVIIDNNKDLVNYIRHKRTNYEEIGYKFTSIKPRNIWKKRVLQAIAAKFPNLAAECRAQICKI